MRCYNRVWRRGFDPAFPLFTHVNPAFRTFFHRFPETRFFVFKICTLIKKKIIAVNTNDLRCRLALLIDILNLRVFYGHCKKGKIAFHISVLPTGGEKGEETKRGREEGGFLSPFSLNPHPYDVFSCSLFFPLPTQLNSWNVKFWR